MTYYLKFFLVLLSFCLFTGCANNSDNCCNSCNSNGPPPKPSPEVKNITREDCEGPSCCKCRKCYDFPAPKGCPRPCGRNGLLQQLACQGVQVIELGNRVDIILFTDNCFETGTANINESCKPALNNIVNLLDSYGGICDTIQVTGYTDNIGYISPKWGLSQHLADSTVAYLWAHGIPLAKLSARGCACNEPIATTHTPCGNAYNRRVEISLWRCRICDQNPR